VLAMNDVLLKVNELPGRKLFKVSNALVVLTGAERQPLACRGHDPVTGPLCGYGEKLQAGGVKIYTTHEEMFAHGRLSSLGHSKVYRLSRVGRLAGQQAGPR